jgi:hypothetical protein
MKLLTPDNRCFEMNSLPDEIEDIRYCVMDVTDKEDPDFFFIPLVFLETFSAPSMNLTIGPYNIEMPIDWNILIGEPELGILEFIPLTSINEREFDTILTNPLAGFTMDWQPVRVNNVFADVKWFFPKLKFGHILAIPLEHGDKPKCAYFTKDLNRIPDQLNSYDFF